MINMALGWYIFDILLIMHWLGNRIVGVLFLQYFLSHRLGFIKHLYIWGWVEKMVRNPWKLENCQSIEPFKEGSKSSIITLIIYHI